MINANLVPYRSPMFPRLKPKIKTDSPIKVKTKLIEVSDKSSTSDKKITKVIAQVANPL